VDPGSGLVLSEDPNELAIYEVCELADERGIESLSHEEQLVVHAWSAKGIIDNGGFRFYFDGAWMIQHVADSFRTLGFEDAADACTDAAGFFPSNLPPRDWQRRVDILKTISAEALKPLDERIWAVEWHHLKAAILTHMERHPGRFGGFRRAAQPAVAADGASPRR
jgi:hypothetical protein